MIDRSSITRAFRTLRAEGYFARQKFWCCQSCGCAAVPNDKAETFVFYHAQDADDLAQDGSCYLAWSGDAKLIRKALEAEGIAVDHDGSGGTRIKITLPK